MQRINGRGAEHRLPHRLSNLAHVGYLRLQIIEQHLRLRFPSEDITKLARRFYKGGKPVRWQR